MATMNGHYNRENEANGPTGIMVLRMRMPYGADAGPCTLQVAAQNSRGGVRDARSHWEELLFTLRRSRGAAGRDQGTTGAAWAAAGVPRRPTDGADGIPGAGKGLK